MLLLSGGEKALTALALLIAIFRYQPSPFCILDEVDAPLDETNVGRFAQMVAEMSADAQFIVVTHNRRTMEMASVLYGVTMQEPGVSKLVSVNWDQARAAPATPPDHRLRIRLHLTVLARVQHSPRDDFLFPFFFPVDIASLCARIPPSSRGLNRCVASPHMSAVVWETNFPGLKLLSRGKVRDLYEVGDDLLLVATDRLSAFDVVLPTPIPDKGTGAHAAFAVLV